VKGGGYFSPIGGESEGSRVRIRETLILPRRGRLRGGGELKVQLRGGDEGWTQARLHWKKGASTRGVHEDKLHFSRRRQTEEKSG